MQSYIKWTCCLSLEVWSCILLLSTIPQTVAYTAYTMVKPEHRPPTVKHISPSSYTSQELSERDAPLWDWHHFCSYLEVAHHDESCSTDPASGEAGRVEDTVLVLLYDVGIPQQPYQNHWGKRNKTNIFIFTYLSSRQNHSSDDGSLSNLLEHGSNNKQHSTCTSCRVGSSTLLDIELQDGKADRMCITLCQDVPFLPSC